MQASYPVRFPPTFAFIQEQHPSWDPFTERHLHCIWFDDRLRPAPLISSDGEEVRILHPGHWNHEKGPDFKDAEWERAGCRFRGDVEIHIRPNDWRVHGHGQDKAYDQVGLHVTYAPGEVPDGELPPGCTEVALKPLLERRSHFFFDAIDPQAYPGRGRQGRNGLQAFFAGRPEEQQALLLEAAGVERLRRKALRFQQLARTVGIDQALYTGLLRGLGYKHNADVAERLAGALPADRLRILSRGCVTTAYALLLGVSGLLPDDPGRTGFPSWCSIRSLWDVWWPQQARFLGRVLSAEDWRLDGCRPGNHPWRRLWAAASWVCAGSTLEARLYPPEGVPSATQMRRVREALCLSAPDGTEAVVGPARAGALFLNVAAPYWISLCDTAPDDAFWQHLPSEPMNAVTKRTGRAMFGPDIHPRLYRGGLRRQGLLQFHEDFQL